MKAEYEQIVKLVCGEDWNSHQHTLDDRDGAYGVAIALAFLRISSSKLPDLAKEIGVPLYLLDMPYKRLQLNGLFSFDSWLLTDPLLVNGDPVEPMRSIRAWCHVAGLASGYCGRGQTREELPSKERD